MFRFLRQGTRPPFYICACFFLASGLLLVACASTPQAKSTGGSGSSTPLATLTPEPVYDFPAINANYVYDQLYYMSLAFQQRESGFDISSEQNGHKAFAQYWAQEMQNNLRGFAPHIAYDYFKGGWISRSSDSPSYNVEVTIPGALHPEQVVVVGSHYDGMHVSQGSAFDDTSGCAIMLGEARALADYWRAHHLYPARTLRFVIFDAEEQGILGSYHYVNSTVNGDTANLVAMINEEQSGFSYPVRFLGKVSNPLIPLHVWNVSASGQPFFADLIKSAVPVVSNEMRMLGYTSVTYHGDRGQDVSQLVFTPEQASQMVIAGDMLGGSDDAGFDQAKVPALTFIAGDEGVYDARSGMYKTPGIPDNQSYPFDTHYDTLQLMNGYANGETKKSQALVLALDFQTMLQAWMFNQPDLVGHVAAGQLPAGPLSAISDIGIVQPGMALKLEAQSAFDPSSPQSQVSYHWNFGDGVQLDGAQVQHIYSHAGTYTLTLNVKDASGTRQISKRLKVTLNPPVYANPFFQVLQRERDTGNELARGDHHPPASFQFPPIVQNGDGLTSDDHFPGHNG